jgi:hypothetical protein
MLEKRVQLILCKFIVALASNGIGKEHDSRRTVKLIQGSTMITRGS